MVEKELAGAPMCTVIEHHPTVAEMTSKGRLLWQRNVVGWGGSGWTGFAPRPRTFFLPTWAREDGVKDDPERESDPQERIKKLWSIKFPSRLHQEAQRKLPTILSVSPFLDLGRSGLEKFLRRVWYSPRPGHALRPSQPSKEI